MVCRVSSVEDAIKITHYAYTEDLGGSNGLGRLCCMNTKLPEAQASSWIAEPVLREQLDRDGFCLFPGVLDAGMLAYLRTETDRLVAEQSAEERAIQRSTGSMIHSGKASCLAPLIAYRPALEALEALGFRDNRFWTGYIISKPGPSPQLFWHQDCTMWNDPRAQGLPSPMLFLMYYLVDTTPANGCLRALPGTHLRRHPLHELGWGHTEGTRSMRDPDDVRRFQRWEEEVDVCVRAGDLLIGDCRMLHASHANTTDQHRTVLTLWYHPEFFGLDESTQAWAAEGSEKMHKHWPEAALELIRPVMAEYGGDAKPNPSHRVPETFGR